MTGWELVPTIIVPILAIVAGVWKYLNWRDDKCEERASHKEISENNRALLQNHLAHHEGTLGPWMKDISERTTRIETKVDILLEMKDD